MRTLAEDVRIGWRTLRKSPGFTGSAALALALGIGANTAVFSVADAFLLKPLPLPNVERLVMVMERRAGLDQDWNPVAPANYADWKRQSRSFEQPAAFRYAGMNITGRGEPEQLTGVQAEGGYFETLGAKPLLGRTFLPGDNEQVAVLGYGLWQRRFGADPNMVGQNVKLDGTDYTVIGIMPKGFQFPLIAELWTPLVLDAKTLAVRNAHSLMVAARLKPAASLGAARAEMRTIATRLTEAYPQTNRGWSAVVLTAREYLLDSYTRQYTILLLAAVAFVLLIACANVANLQFARATRRQKEIAVRAALGASRWRVIRQLLTESALLGLGGALAGVWLGRWGIDLILGYMPAEVSKYIAGWDRIGLDGRTLAFTIAVAMAGGILAGLAPAWQSSRLDLQETLKEGGRGSSLGGHTQRARSILVVAEIALALILLAGAGLMMRGFGALISRYRQFEPDTLLTMNLKLPQTRYKDAHQRAAFYTRLAQELDSTPQARTVAFASELPFANGTSRKLFAIEGSPLEAGEARFAVLESISASYFRALHIPLMAGREFDGRDGEETQPVAIVSQNLARRYFPGQDPLGRHIKMGTDSSTEKWRTIVGVAGDVTYEWADRQPQPAIYLPYPQQAQAASHVVVRTGGDPMRLAEVVRRQVTKVDAEQPVADIQTLGRLIHNSMLGLAYVAVMMGILGAVALALSAVGIYGVMAYAVTERTHEIGIRMAVGAGQREVLGMVVRRGALLTGAGLAIGLPLAMLLARLLAGLIFGVSATDWISFGGVTAGLTVVALTACALPAARAARIDPVEALRYQ